MRFDEALKAIGASTERLRFPVTDAKLKEGKDRKKIYRRVWRTMVPKFPGKYIWVTSQNIPMLSIGGGQGMPLVMECCDFIADDWEVYDGDD